jgi:hypothetical protein
VSRHSDRLYELLPQFHRRRDAETGESLRALLGVIAEQVDLVESDIEQLYDDWFIETCAPWAVPYLGDLIGYRTLRGYAEAVTKGGTAAKSLTERLAPRADVAATVTNRRRKGTLPLLESIAHTVADWPARAVEFQPLLAACQPVRLYPGDEGGVARRLAATKARLVDVRRGADLDLLGSPFDDFARTAAAPRISSPRRPGRYSPPAVGLFVWRLKPYSITKAPAYCNDRARNLFTFSILGNDIPLVTKPVPEPSPTHLATTDNVPAFIRRRALADRLTDYYGPGKSFQIWRDNENHPVPPGDIVVADLSEWTYRPQRKQVAVDPVLGRIAFGARSAPKRGVWVTYHYAFSDDMGGGEYPRERPQQFGVPVYRVGPGQPDKKIMAAYQRWREDKAADAAKSSAIIEITDSGAYQEQTEFILDHGDRLEVRAAEGVRPVIRLLDWYSNRPDALIVEANPPDDDHNELDVCDRPKPPRLVLDGLLITGRGVHVSGPMGQVVIRHCTLVPGWTLEPECRPAQPDEPSLILENTTACLQIERSILGTILVISNEVCADPLQIHIADSILDATGPHREALSAPECRHAHATVSIYRSTVVGEVHTHAIRIGENSIFDGRVHVARRGIGCLRFCYVPPGSRTPRRYQCQPDLVHSALRERAELGELDPAELPASRTLEAQRVRPRFTSVRYGTPAYGRLAAGCAPEIARGAEDGSELGAFHDLFQPQREDNLLARLEEFLPAGMDGGISYVS